jgi:hypothetical protein
MRSFSIACNAPPQSKGDLCFVKEFLCLQQDSLIVFLCTGAQYVTMQKYFSDPSLVIYFFSNPTHKTKIGTANRWETTSSKPPLVNQKQGTTLTSYLLHSSLADASFCRTFY